MKTFTSILLLIGMAIAVSSCAIFRGTGEAVEGVGHGVGSAVEGVGSGVGTAVGGTGEAIGSVGD